MRVPVLRSHSEALTIETERPLTPDEARELLRNAPGVKVVDEPSLKRYPMPLDTSDQDLIYAGRIRVDESAEGNGLVLWVCGDQIRLALSRYPTFIIGGAQVYGDALKMPEIDTIYATEIDASFSLDRKSVV